MRETGILPDQDISALFQSGALKSPRALDADQIQPASLDLRLGDRAWRVRASSCMTYARICRGSGLVVVSRIMPKAAHARPSMSTCIPR